MQTLNLTVSFIAILHKETYFTLVKSNGFTYYELYNWIGVLFLLV